MSAYKVIQSGHIIEIYKYEKWFNDKHIEHEASRKGGRKEEGGKEELKQKYQADTNYRARQKLRRLILSNFDDSDLFITITFKDNIQDIEWANYQFKKFVQKLKRRQQDFKHVTVIEFQKRGAIHYHMICNYQLEWHSPEELKIWERKLAELWGHGFIDIKDITGIDNTGAYLIKYMSKDHIDERLEGKKRYFFSRNMIQPKEIKDTQTLLNVIETFENKSIPQFTSRYETEFFGRVEYMEFNPKRLYNN